MSDVDDVADFVDEEAHGAVVRADDDVRVLEVRRGGRQAEPMAKIERRDDLAAKVDEPTDDGRCERHRGHLVEAQHFLDLEYVDAEVVIADEERAELGGVAAHAVTSRFVSKNHGTPRLTSVGASSTSVTRPPTTE